MRFGYSEGILAHDVNLAQGLPVREMPMTVRGTTAQLDKAAKNLVPGDFEERRGDTFSGWGFQDEPGAGTFADEAIKHGGKSSLRINNPAGVSGNRRVNKLLKVRPWSQFHASIWIKTAGFESADETKMFAMSRSGRVLAHSSLGVMKDQDWTEHHVVFNSLENSEVLFYAGTWDCRGGKLWMDDIRVVEEPFVNLVRRSGCPLVVTDESGNTTYTEGQDFVELRDSKMGTTPWAGSFDVYHEPPKLTIKSRSRIKDGDRLKVSFFHAVTVYDSQVPCSLTEPRVFEVVEDQVRRVARVFEPKTYFLSHDEIRVAGWSDPERASGSTAGQLLADNVRRCCDIVRKVTPDAKLVIWGDMFDPHHNAVKAYYYLVNGDLTGSWEGLPNDTLIMNWNHGKAKASLSHFAGRGHSQALAGYYDQSPDSIRDWLATGRDLKGVSGAMYTTWTGNFSQIERFAEAAWGGK